jgi:hypothetical protein
MLATLFLYTPIRSNAHYLKQSQPKVALFSPEADNPNPDRLNTCPLKG